MAGELVSLSLVSLSAIFFVVDPLSAVPFFLARTREDSPEKRRETALRAALTAGVVLAAFALAGEWLFRLLGISLAAFRVAGGVLLFRIAVDMVFAHLERETAEEESEARARSDVSVFPLAIPLIAGPGALASLLILAGEARAVPLGLPLALGVCMLVVGLVYLALRAAARISGLLGQTGINVVTRVLGVLLAALATQYVADGIRGLL